MPDLHVRSLDGSSFTAYAAAPPGRNGSGLILIHEFFGLNDTMRGLCDFLASQGYLALCPDLFWRQGSAAAPITLNESDWGQAGKLYKEFDVEAALRDLLATLAHLRQTPGCSGKVGAIGYCLGGRLSFLLAARSDLDCAVSYYGVGIDSLLDEIHDIRAPFMLHLAEQDSLLPPPIQAKIIKAMARNSFISTFSYPGVGHGFARPDGAGRLAAAAQTASDRTLAFLKEHLRA